MSVLSVLVDDIVVSPKEIFPEGIEASLSDAGLQIIGAHFGEVVKKGTEVKTPTGVVMVDREAQTRQVVLKLMCREDSDATLPEAAARLEQIVGALQARDGWFRRDFKLSGKFASLLYHISGEVSLVDFMGWQVGDSPDVTLSMVCDYAAYLTEEEASAIFESEEDARELIFELDEVGGSVEGLIRVLVKNEGEEHLRGLILAGECLDHPQDETADTTAALAYDCADLTPKGGAKEAEREGLKVVRHSELTAGWLAILNGEIDGVGHMTHKSVRRPEFRVYDPSEEAGDVQFKLRYRSLGTLQWSETSVFKSRLVDDWQTVTWDELVRLADPGLGDRRWEWELQVRAYSGSGSIDLHRVRIAPTEIYVRCIAPAVAQAADLQSQKSPGTLENDASAGGTAWTNQTNAKSSDNTYATLKGEGGKTVESQYLLVKKLALALPETATVTGIVVQMERKSSANNSKAYVADIAARIVKGGSIGSIDKAAVSNWPTSDAILTYGASDDLWGETWTPSNINAEGFGFAIRAKAVSVKVGDEATASIDAVSVIVYFTEADDPNRICFAERSIEIATDGAKRQHPEDDVWGIVIPEGFYPTATPSELEGRKTRFMIVPSQGDFGDLPDSGENPLSAQVFVRPGVLYAGGESE